MSARFGTVVFYSSARGFGFLHEISSNPSSRLPEWYFHVTSVVGRLVLKTGDPVQFELAKSARTGRDEAVNVHLVAGSSALSNAGGFTLNEIMQVDADVDADGGTR